MHLFMPDYLVKRQLCSCFGCVLFEHTNEAKEKRNHMYTKA